MKTRWRGGMDHTLWALLDQARHSIVKIRQEELRKYGITTREAAALQAIHILGNKVSPAEISRWVFREHHTVTALLSRMEKKGLIIKTGDAKRKNEWRIDLTQSGVDVYAQVTKRKSIRTVLSVLSKDERRVLESFLKRLLDKALYDPVCEIALPFPLPNTKQNSVYATRGKK